MIYMDTLRMIVDEIDVSKCWGDPLHLHVGVMGEGYYVQVKCTETTCNDSGNVWEWSGRKWYISPHVTHSEIINTCFAAVKMAIEHEVRERFLWRGVRIYDPHVNLPWLANHKQTEFRSFNEEQKD